MATNDESSENLKPILSSDRPDADNTAPLSERLESETGYLGWSDLVRFFARGVVVKVDPSLDLVAVGKCMSIDDSDRLKAWLENGLVARASDDDARRWSAGSPTFLALVTAPWVLVQEKSPA